MNWVIKQHGQRVEKIDTINDDEIAGALSDLSLMWLYVKAIIDLFYVRFFLLQQEMNGALSDCLK